MSPIHDQGHPPETLAELARVLASIVDLDEATVAFRLPEPSTAFAAR